MRRTVKSWEIDSEEKYKAALARLEKIWDASPISVEGKELAKLIAAILAYEDRGSSGNQFLI